MRLGGRLALREHHQTVRDGGILGQKNDGQKDSGYEVIIFLSPIFLSGAAGQSTRRRTYWHVMSLTIIPQDAMPGMVWWSLRLQTKEMFTAVASPSQARQLPQRNLTEDDWNSLSGRHDASARWRSAARPSRLSFL